MREKLWRHGRAARQILGARNRRDQGPNVGYHAEVPLVKERLELQQIRMQSEVAAIAVRQRQRKERGLRNRERASSRGVGGVAVRVVGNEHVVRVVAAIEEKADQRLVIGCVERRGAEPAQIENGVENAGGGESGT